MDDNKLKRTDVVCMAVVALLAITSYFRADNPATNVVARKYRAETRQTMHISTEKTPRR